MSGVTPGSGGDGGRMNVKVKGQVCCRLTPIYYISPPSPFLARLRRSRLLISPWELRSALVNNSLVRILLN
jgi:hypothetical protein